MTFQPQSVQPPRIAVWLIRLFAVGEEAESMLGDLLEEFHSSHPNRECLQREIGTGGKPSRLSHALQALLFALRRG